MGYFGNLLRLMDEEQRRSNLYGPSAGPDPLLRSIFADENDPFGPPREKLSDSIGAMLGLEEPPPAQQAMFDQSMQ